MKKKKESSALRFVRSFGSFVPLFVFLALVANLFVIFKFESSRKPQVIYSVEKVFVNTNVSDTAVSSRPRDKKKAVSPTFDPIEIKEDLGEMAETLPPLRFLYDYCIVSGYRVIKMFGRTYGEGSSTSYGRIEKIYPERVLLDNGRWIENLNWLGSSSGLRSGPTNKVVNSAGAVASASTGAKASGLFSTSANKGRKK